MNTDPLAERPPIAAPDDFSPQTPEIFTLANGATVWLLERPDIPLLSLRLIVRGGASEDPAWGPGLASLTDNMLTHGAADRDASAFAAFAEQQAIGIGVSTGSSASLVYLDTHTQRIDAAFDLLADVLLQPRFDAEEVDRVRALQIGDIQQTLDDVQGLAPDIAARIYFGPRHPLAHPEIGTESGLLRLSADDLRRSWQRRYVASRAHFVVVGAIDAATLAAQLNARLGDWTTGATIPASPPPQGITGGPALRMVDHPGASQSTLRVVMPGWNAAADTRVAGDLATTVLGGTFTSRLNRLMREEKGYTYGASARAYVSQNFGTLVASTSVERGSTGETLIDMLTTLQSGHDGFSDEELSRARESKRTDVIESMGTRSQTAALFSRLAQQGRLPEDLERDLQVAAALETDALQAAWQDRADLNRALILVIGDLETIREDVESALEGDWQVVEATFPTPDRE